jgi:hypothetical protein
MALTPGGLPYPVGTDKVVDGDDAIHALALGVDPAFIAWVPYTPTWAAGGTPVTLGTGGAVTGRRRKVGKTVDVKVLALTGTGFNGGAASAPWTWTLPTGIGLPNDHYSVSGWVQAPGGAIALAVIAAHIVANGTVIDTGVTGPGNTLVGGFAMPAGSILLMQARYEVP